MDCAAMADSFSENSTGLFEPVPRATLHGRALAMWSRLWRAEVRYAVAFIVCAPFVLFAFFFNYFDWDVEAIRTVQALPVPGFQSVMRYVSSFGSARTITTVTALRFWRVPGVTKPFGLPGAGWAVG